MKKILIISCVLALLAACQTTDKKAVSSSEKTEALSDSANFTSLQWIDSNFVDLGKVKNGAVVEVSYRFKNLGTKNLIIADVVPGCGCTVPEKPEEPIAPGEEGVIRAKFDSKDRIGTNDKFITVTANTTPQQHTLRFKVEVTN
jgi:hypothetical protein